jgi:LDH2 family malate/lactate/ureidoglycolate dehydrogenase
MYSDFERPQDVGHFMIGIDISRFLPYEDFIKRMDALASEARGIEPAPGFSEVMVPGEPEDRIAAIRMQSGIPLAEATVLELRDLGTKASIPFPEASK